MQEFFIFCKSTNCIKSSVILLSYWYREAEKNLYILVLKNMEYICFKRKIKNMKKTVTIRLFIYLHHFQLRYYPMRIQS